MQLIAVISVLTPLQLLRVFSRIKYHNMPIIITGYMYTKWPVNAKGVDCI